MFPFQCPAGHLVQAEKSHAGQPSSCPTCGVAMIIPSPLPDANTGNVDSSLAPESPAQNAIQVGEQNASPAPVGIMPALNATPEFFHIPCPNGHPLETPADMIGEYAKCPQCGVEFDLREEDSEEYRRRRQMQEESELANLDRKWLNRAIAIVVLVALGGVVLVIATMLNR